MDFKHDLMNDSTLVRVSQKRFRPIGLALQLPRHQSGYKCLECSQNLTQEGHFAKFKNHHCIFCSFETQCNFAFASHQSIHLKKQITTLLPPFEYGIGKFSTLEVLIDKNYECCDCRLQFQTRLGNKLAKHLAKCPNSNGVALASVNMAERKTNPVNVISSEQCSSLSLMAIKDGKQGNIAKKYCFDHKMDDTKVGTSKQRLKRHARKKSTNLFKRTSTSLGKKILVCQMKYFADQKTRDLYSIYLMNQAKTSCDTYSRLNQILALPEMSILKKSLRLSATEKLDQNNIIESTNSSYLTGDSSLPLSCSTSVDSNITNDKQFQLEPAAIHIHFTRITPSPVSSVECCSDCNNNQVCLDDSVASNIFDSKLFYTAEVTDSCNNFD